MTYKTSIRRGGGGIRRKRRGSSRRSSRTEKTLLLEVETDEDVDIESYLDKIVYVYLLNSKCGTQAQAGPYKTCVTTCIANHNTPTSISNCISSTCGNDCELLSNIGSGVFYKANQFFTNHHVIKVILTYTATNKYYSNISAIIENNSGDNERISRIVWHNSGADVALVETAQSVPNAEIAILGNLSDIKLLHPLFTIGNPASVKWVASQGHLTKKPPVPVTDCRSDCITHSIPTFSGNSGGPIFDLKTGKLVALHAGTILDRANNRISHLGFGPHIDKIKSLISSNTQTQSYRVDNPFQSVPESQRVEINEVFIDYVVDQLDTD